MFVPLTVGDFLERAATAYAERVGVIDEPDQPAEPLGDLTYARLAELVRAQAAGLDTLDVRTGDRVASVSHNGARLLTSFFGVSASGRVLVPINFRLSTDEVAYIVKHSESNVLILDPELEDSLAGVACQHRIVLGGLGENELFRFGLEPREWSADESATATINYTSGTTARPKGVQLSHRSLWVNAILMAAHLGVSDRDVYLHTLPMFHANGWGMPYAVTGMGAKAHRASPGRWRGDPAPGRPPRGHPDVQGAYRDQYLEFGVTSQWILQKGDAGIRAMEAKTEFLAKKTLENIVAAGWAVPDDLVEAVRNPADDAP